MKIKHPGKNDCPNQRQLERFCLDYKPSDLQYGKMIEKHLSVCPKCRARYQEFSTFYNVLSREIRKPVSNTLFDFSKTLAPDDVKYGLLLCQPVPEKNSRFGKAYRTTLLFSANGRSDGSRLADHNLQHLPPNCCAIRLYSDPKCNSIMLFLWSPETENYEGWQIYIPECARNKLNSSGGVKLSMKNLRQLDNKVIYLFKISRKTSKSTPFKQIQTALAL